MVWSRADDIIDIREDGSGDAASNVSADVAQLPQLDRQRVTSNSLWVRHPLRRPAKNFTGRIAVCSIRRSGLLSRTFRGYCVCLYESVRYNGEP